MDLLRSESAMPLLRQAHLAQVQSAAVLYRMYWLLKFLGGKDFDQILPVLSFPFFKKRKDSVVLSVPETSCYIDCREHSNFTKSRIPVLSVLFLLRTEFPRT